jgi:4-diphosphocytidyl-2-C-methyl-D-erythritol kinase
LEVTGRRPDGYHELVSVFQAINLCDVLEFSDAADLTLVSEPALPFDADANLAMRAARLLAAAAPASGGAQIRLRKRIPVAAGLGGGSADAAATLLGLRALWGLGSFDLRPAAEQLGSDVPYFLSSATVLVQGRGELLRPLPPLPVKSVVLVRPLAALATRDVFAALAPTEWSDGGASLALAAALADGRGLEHASLANTLLPAAERCCPALARLRAGLQDAGWTPHLSGSGPTLFLLPDSAPEATRMRIVARALGAESWSCRTLRRPPLRVLYC